MRDANITVRTILGHLRTTHYATNRQIGQTDAAGPHPTIELRGTRFAFLRLAWWLTIRVVSGLVTEVVAAETARTTGRTSEWDWVTWNRAGWRPVAVEFFAATASDVARLRTITDWDGRAETVRLIFATTATRGHGTQT